MKIHLDSLDILRSSLASRGEGRAPSTLDEALRLSYFGENHSYYEWKFGGKLGSGGKFRSVTGGKFRVSSYPDSAGEREREALEKRLNDEIEAIRLRHAGA